MCLHAGTCHQRKQILRLIRRRCVLTHAPDILYPMRPVRPDLRRNIPYVLTQRRVLPTSRLPQILPLVASSSSSCSLRVTSSLRPDVSRPSSPLKYSQPELIRCFLRRWSAGVWGSGTFFFTSRISRITYHASLVWRTHDVGLKSLLYLLYTVSRSCMILPHSRVLILSSRFFNKPH